jgi:hypothetical protein
VAVLTMSVRRGKADFAVTNADFRKLTLLGLPGMSPQSPLLGETRSEMLGVSLSAKRSHWHGAEGKLDFRTSHILTAFAKSVSPHSYNGRMKSDWVWIARPLRSRHFRP